MKNMNVECCRGFEMKILGVWGYNELGFFYFIKCIEVSSPAFFSQRFPKYNCSVKEGKTKHIWNGSCQG